MRAPSVRVSCSLLILQLIKPNIPDGVSTGLLGAGPLPHCPGIDRQEGQVGGGKHVFSKNWRMGTSKYPRMSVEATVGNTRAAGDPRVVCSYSAPLDP